MRGLPLLLALAACPARAGGGAELFDAHGCRACHKVGLRGGNAGPDLTVVGHRRPRAWLETWLASPRAYKHDTKMPEQGLADLDIAALTAYLSGLKGQDWGARRPWQGLSGSELGKMIFARAGCAACHGAGGRGGHPNPGAFGGVIPALPKLLATYKKEELVNKLRRGATPDRSGAQPAAASMPAWEGVLSDPELNALADWLLSKAEKSVEEF